MCNVQCRKMCSYSSNNIILFSVEQCVHPGDDPDDYREHCEHGSTVRPGDNQGSV